MYNGPFQKRLALQESKREATVIVFFVTYQVYPLFSLNSLYAG